MNFKQIVWDDAGKRRECVDAANSRTATTQLHFFFAGTSSHPELSLTFQTSAPSNLEHYNHIGCILDVYVPRDPKRSGHRGFGFVTFAEDGVADRVSRRPHEICGQQVALDSATPVDDASPSENFMMNGVGSFGGYGGPMRTYGRMYGSLDFEDWGYGIPSGRPSRTDWRDLGMGHDEMRGLFPIAFEYSARMLFTKASSSAHMLHAMNCAPK
ncbi:protein gar2-like [Arachis stenosperma]|uniref:protein gar2-like n=1 Tax=Arachis stenosperma TaxID=217475 RepID=UPI0025AB5E38|nr:protein gar2-like [Arachis stenosperma]